MQPDITYQTTFTLPTGATSGARIVLDGLTGIISVYNSSNQLVDTIGGSNGDITSISGASGNVAQMHNGTFVLANSTSVSDLNDAAVISASSPQIAVVPDLLFTSPAVPSFTDRLLMFLFGGLPGLSTGQTSVPTVQFVDGAASSDVDMKLSGSIRKTNKDGTEQPWQTVGTGGITFGLGWADDSTGGGAQRMQYKIDAQDHLLIEGVCHTTSATPAAAIFNVGTSPVDYRPVITQRQVIVTTIGGSQVVNRAIISNATGSVQLATPLTAANIDVFFGIHVTMGRVI